MSEAADRELIWAMLTKMDQYVHTYLSQPQRQWWQKFYTRHTQHDFEITQDTYDRVDLALTNIRYEYKKLVALPADPPGLSTADCKHTLNIFCSLRPDITPTVALGLRQLALMRACLDNI